MTTKLVKGMPVVSLADGATLGVVDHVYFDPGQLAVVGFTFHQRGGLFGGGASGLIDISDVHAFGSDAVTVNDVAVVRSDLTIEVGHGELLDLETLLKRTVMTETGETIGRVAAIQFGDASHALVALDLDADGGPRRIAASEIKTVGPELIIVADQAQAAPPVTVRTIGPIREITASRVRREEPGPEKLRVIGA